MFLIGIIVGAIARLGIVGSYVGGFLAPLFSEPPEGTVVHPQASSCR
jgi:hypothetical protein